MYTCYIKILASFHTWAGWFESHLVENPEDMFSRDVAQLVFMAQLVFSFIMSPKSRDFQTQSKVVLETDSSSWNNKLNPR